MSHIVILGLYLALLLVIFAMITLIVMHIGEFRQYSKYLSIVLRIYLVVVVCISVFGMYKILTGKYVVPKKSNVQTQKLEF